LKILPVELINEQESDTVSGADEEVTSNAKVTSTVLVPRRISVSH
jgi:hypothetical protein